MSIPIPTVLWWSRHQHRFCARHRGVQVEASSAPPILGLPPDTIEIDFFGGRHELQTERECRREMTSMEETACIGFLEQMAAAARAVFGLKD